MNKSTEENTTSEENTTPPRQWPVRVDLKHPIEFGKQHISQLEFRRCRLGDLKGMKVDGIPPVDHLIMLASRMSGQFTSVIDRLDAEDASEVLAIALESFTSCLEGGRTP